MKIITADPTILPMTIPAIAPGDRQISPFPDEVLLFAPVLKNEDPALLTSKTLKCKPVVCYNNIVVSPS